MCVVPMIGSPPIPIAVDCPMPRTVNWYTASYVSVPERDTIPTEPSLWMRAGMMPTLALPGEITPGQFGPTNLDFDRFTTSHTFTMSSVGMPSVMQTISGSPASSASRIPSAANGGGTKIMVAFAPVALTASSTVLKTGQPS